MRTTLIFFVLIISSQLSVYADSYPDVARVYRVQSDLDTLQEITEEYKSIHGVYPPVSDWKPYITNQNRLNRTPKDPWGREYHYSKENGTYRIWSLGRDGIVGGIGEDFDYSNRTPDLNQKQREIVSKKHYINPVFLYFLFLCFSGLCVLLLYILWSRKRRSTRK